MTSLKTVSSLQDVLKGTRKKHQELSVYADLLYFDSVLYIDIAAHTESTEVNQKLSDYSL